MTKAFYPGSFDPFHNGHLEIIKSASKIFESVVIGVGTNPEKTDYFLDQSERFLLVKSCLDDLNNVEVVEFQGLAAYVASKIDANCILKGVRSSTDLDDEMLQSRINSSTGDSIQTVFLPGISEFGLVSSRYIRQVSILGGDLSKLVPLHVAQHLAKR